MNSTARVMTFCALLLGTSAAAQFFPFPSSARPAEGWPAEIVEIYQPIVTDTTVLFPVPWLVWQCSCVWPIEYEFYYDVDFSRVRTCWGRKEIFDRVAVNGQYGFVQREPGELHAMLEATAEGFTYTERPGDDTEPTRTVEYIFDTDHVLRTDTSAVGHWGHDGLVTRLTHYVELRRVP